MELIFLLQTSYLYTYTLVPYLLSKMIAQAMLGSLLTLLIFAVADVVIILLHSITFLVLSAKRAVKFIFCSDHQQQKSDAF